MPFITGLKCRVCEARYDEAPIYVCEECFGPLEVDYDYQAMARVASREHIERGPANLWRYADLLPVSVERAVGIPSGFTPLIVARRLGEALGLRDLWIKNDCLNPSYSFKDRVVAMAVPKPNSTAFATAIATTRSLNE